MTPDDRLLRVVSALTQLANRWWMHPLRRRLQAAACEVATAARETAKMRRTLDEIVQDAREQMHQALVAADAEPRRIDAIAVHRAVNAELDAIVSGWRRP